MMGLALAKKPDARQQEARAHFSQGRAFQDAGAYDDAIREYQAAYQLTPLPLLLFNIAQSYRLKGDKRAAIEHYEKYLAADSEGPAADEARDHVANLKLKLQLEETEALRKKAAEEAAEARRIAEQAERERRRAVEAEEARRKGAADEETRLRRLADEMAQAQAKRRAQEAEQQRQRMEAARKVGRPYLIAGGVTIAAGMALAVVFVWIPVADATSKQDQFEHATTWSTDRDAEVQQVHDDSRTMIGLWAAGGALAVTGIALCIAGGKLRSNAVERVSFAPLVSPKLAGLTLEGRF
jgi:tetratricopeptide (TPR) repeat protein